MRLEVSGGNSRLCKPQKSTMVQETNSCVNPWPLKTVAYSCSENRWDGKAIETRAFAQAFFCGAMPLADVKKCRLVSGKETSGWCECLPSQRCKHIGYLKDVISFCRDNTKRKGWTKIQMLTERFPSQPTWRQHLPKGSKRASEMYPKIDEPTRSGKGSPCDLFPGSVGEQND